MQGGKIIDCSGYLPTKVISNYQLENFLDTSNNWIKERTGIRIRRIADNHINTYDLAMGATRKILKNNSYPDIDAIIVASTTQDQIFPSLACQIQKAITNKSYIPAFDIQAVCSGFIYGLEIANNFIISNKYQSILLITAEKMSKILDWEDRSTCVLFGDGAAATIITKSNNNENYQSNIIDIIIKSDGSLWENLQTIKKTAKNNISEEIIHMEGRNIFKYSIDRMSNITKHILDKNHINLKEVKFFIFHQANLRILECVAKSLNISKNQLVISIDEHANCSAASIPLALSKLLSNNQINRGDLIVCTAFGAGATWGSALIRW